MVKYLTKHQVRINRYNTSYLDKTENFKDSYHPNNNNVKIDYLIKPILKILNDKGYYTKYSCSGHGNREHFFPYIYFSEKSKKINSVPKYWIFEKDNDNILCMPKGRKYINRKFAQRKTIKYMQLYLKYLYNWALKLQ